MKIHHHEKVFDEYESGIRSYCRGIPSKFVKAKNEYVWDSDGNRYLDALSGSGSLNYGHNNPIIKERMIEYLRSDGIVQSLDFYTEEKEKFLISLQEILLRPKGYNYKVQFCSPCGMAAVEAAIKLARYITKRTNIIYFSNSFHGMSVGALAVSDIQKRRDTAGVTLNGGICFNYCRDGENAESNFDDFCLHLEKLTNANSKPAAIIIEVVQGEGGMHAAQENWLRMISSYCKTEEILLIVDDIQSGCGRTGGFFGFGDLGIIPDIVCVSKSISGYGIPLAFILIKNGLDCQPIGHNAGTFRGNNLAFLCARMMLETYWRTTDFETEIKLKSDVLRTQLIRIFSNSATNARISGRGMMIGIQFLSPNESRDLQLGLINKNIIIERCGPESKTVKVMLPLTVSEAATYDFISKVESVA